MFVPLTAAVVVQKFLVREPLRGELGISFRLNRWFAVAWLLPVPLVLATIGASLFVPGVEYGPDLNGLLERLAPLLTPDTLQAARAKLAVFPPGFVWLGLLQGLMAGATVNAVAAFGEEAGWRGLLLHELRGLGFWPASAVIGVIWGLWHAPLILHGHNYPQHPVLGVLMMTLVTLLLSPLFTYVRKIGRAHV